MPCHLPTHLSLLSIDKWLKRIGYASLSYRRLPPGMGRRGH
jgi:hypothetical protein